MPPVSYRYRVSGLGPLLFIPWIGLLTAVALGYILIARPIPLVPSTLPAGYFALVLAIVTTTYFFRYDWHRRQRFETADAGLTVISPFGARNETAWSDLVGARFHTNTGALVLKRSAQTALVLYPRSLQGAPALIAELDARTSLALTSMPDLHAAIQSAV